MSNTCSECGGEVCPCCGRWKPEDRRMGQIQLLPMVPRPTDTIRPCVPEPSTTGPNPLNPFYPRPVMRSSG